VGEGKEREEGGEGRVRQKRGESSRKGEGKREGPPPPR